MKTLTIITMLAFASSFAHAQMGSINDDVLSPQSGAKASRIAYLKADIAEKQKIMEEDRLRAIRAGAKVHNESYQRIIDAEKAELKNLGD